MYGTSGGYSRPAYGRSNPIPIHNPFRSQVYVSNDRAVYIGVTAYHAPASANVIKDSSEMMFDIRAVQSIYSPMDGYMDKPKDTKNYEIPKIGYTRIIFRPNDFLKAYRPQTRWVGSFEEVKDTVERIYKKVTNNSLPNVEINIVSNDEIYREYGKSGRASDGSLQGFYCDGRIFVKEGRLDEMILTLGHELGHATAVQLTDPELEEAKAYAFTEAWVKAIVDENIEGLSKCIETTRKKSVIPEWASVHLNGYKTFVERLNNGLSPMEIIENLIAIDRHS